MEERTLIRICIFLICLYLTFMLLSCSEEPISVRKDAGTVSYTITAQGGACVERGLYSIAVVDAEDKLSQSVYFTCSEASDCVRADSGDLLEIRVFKNGFEFDRTVLYNITVTQNGVDTTFAEVDFKGIKYLVK